MIRDEVHDVIPDGPRDAVAPNEEAVSVLERLDVVVVGHVDHGKSTVIGRLMADTGSLPEGKLEQVRAQCDLNSRPFEYAFLLDALKNEQAQGITIDTARCFFNTANRHYIIHDAPGHVEFLKNMITGASRAQAALLVIDAKEGVRENSKRHGYILSMLGIRQIAVLVNKMDLLGWDRDAFEAVRSEYSEFLARLGVRPRSFIPISARDGDNIVARTSDAEWYDGPTVLEQVESFERLDDELDRPFRMPLQDVYKFTAAGDDRRIFAGTIETGRLRPGDEVLFWPSGKTSTVRSLEALIGEGPTEAHAGQAVGFTLETQVYVRPGELVSRSGEPSPVVADRLRATVFWMASAPLVRGLRYALRVGTASVPVVLEEVLSVLDASELESVTGVTQVERHDVAEVVLRTVRPVAFDPSDVLESMSRFVIVAGYEIAGCGIVLEGMESEPESPVLRHEFTPGLVTAKARERRYRHSGKAVIVNSVSANRALELGSRLEQRLFESGVHSYYLGATGLAPERETLARDSGLLYVGETARAMAEAGVVFVASVTGLDRFDVQRLRALSAPQHVLILDLSLYDACLDEAELSFSCETPVDEVLEETVKSLLAIGVLSEYEI